MRSRTWARRHPVDDVQLILCGVLLGMYLACAVFWGKRKVAALSRDSIEDTLESATRPMPSKKPQIELAVTCTGENMEIACISCVDQLLRKVLPNDADAQCRVLDACWHQAHSREGKETDIDLRNLHDDEGKKPH